MFNEIITKDAFVEDNLPTKGYWVGESALVQGYSTRLPT